jgi:hypothetical protein
MLNADYATVFIFWQRYYRRNFIGRDTLTLTTGDPSAQTAK